MADQQITKASIRESLERLGIRRDDRIVMHSDLRKLAKARLLVRMSNCGADCLIDAFLEQIGPNGILCVPTFTSTFLNPSSGPVGETFDPDTTPSRVGSLTNVVLQRPDRARSLHPTHSWAAIGKDAGDFVKGHEDTSTFGRDSICGRMYDWDFKIVWFGTTGTTNTSTHFGEDWLDLPNMTTEDALVRDGDSYQRVTVYRSPSGPRSFYANGCRLDRLLDEWGIQTVGNVHDAAVRVMSHREFMDRELSALIEDPCLLLHENRDDAYHRQFYRLNVEHVERLVAKHGPDLGKFPGCRCCQERPG
jgi:aminoglycoside 3-N-acetyltransferase